tara:strand:+ start:251 stop:457 length:207 start_codon:yes stop_codon:yes gene_type:complete
MSESAIDNILDEKSNKVQSIIKLETAKENLEGVCQALSMHKKPRLEMTLITINNIIKELKKEVENNKI